MWVFSTLANADNEASGKGLAECSEWNSQRGNDLHNSIPEGFQDVVPEGKMIVDHLGRRLGEEVGQRRTERWRSFPLHKTLATMFLYATAAYKIVTLKRSQSLHPVGTGLHVLLLWNIKTRQNNLWIGSKSTSCSKELFAKIIIKHILWLRGWKLKTSFRLISLCYVICTNRNAFLILI